MKPSTFLTKIMGIKLLLFQRMFVDNIKQKDKTSLAFQLSVKSIYTMKQTEQMISYVKIYYSLQDTAENDNHPDVVKKTNEIVELAQGQFVSLFDAAVTLCH